MIEGFRRDVAWPVVPVEFLSDEDLALFGRFQGPLSQEDLDRVCFLDDADRALIEKRRGDHMRLGFAVQLVTLRYLGAFLADPLDVPHVVVDYLAEQLAIDDPSCLKLYAERAKTPLEHTWEIEEALGFVDFASTRADLEEWVEARSWTTGDGPKLIFTDAVEWPRNRQVLLPGGTVLARLVASVRDATTARIWGAVAAPLTDSQRMALDELLRVRDGERMCDLERLRRSPSTVSGPGMVRALERVRDVKELAIPDPGDVPMRRLIELSRYGLSGKPASLRRHRPARRHATLAASVLFLEHKAIDDALELLELLVANELVGTAARAADREMLRTHARLTDAAGSLRSAVRLLLDGINQTERPSLDELRESIEDVIPVGALEQAVATVEALAPAGSGRRQDWRAVLSARRIVTVSRFLSILTEVIDFDADLESQPVLDAMLTIPSLLAQRRPMSGDDIDESIVPAAWRPAVFGGSSRSDGGVDKNSYVFCVLVEFQRHLKRRGIYAPRSTRWTDPRVSLLDGNQWENTKNVVLTALALPNHPTGLLVEHRTALDDAYRRVAAHLDDTGSDLSVDDAGRVHLAALDAIPEPDSLVELRRTVGGMLPRVDLSQIVLEVMSWEPGFVEAFRSWSGGDARLDGLDISIAACLVAQAMNVGYAPMVNRSNPALHRNRLSHVAQTYLSADNMGAANRPLIERQADIDFADLLGGGLVAAVDGMRFVVPTQTIHARPNRRYFGRRKGVTWLNMINDQAIGLGAKVVSGTVRDSLHVIDVVHNQDGGQRPDIIVTDTASYSDLVFGLLHLLGYSYRPALADMPDQKMWTIGRPPAAYGSLTTAARGRISLDRIEQHWPDMLRIVGSIHTGTVRAYDIVRMLQRDGRPTPLGDAISSYGRIFKSMHMLDCFDNDTYRRDIKGIRNLQEGRHALAQRVFHGRKGELFQRYHEGMEDRLGALGLVVNCIVLWNTYYIDLAIKQLRADGHQVNDEDVARLSPYVRSHVNVHGTYSFSRPDTSNAPRPLRDPTVVDADQD